MKLSFKYEPNKNIDKLIKEKCDKAAQKGATTFHDIEIREEVMPSMSGLMEKRVKQNIPYKYGEGVGEPGGTRLELTTEDKKSKGEVITSNPNLENLFYGRVRIHRTRKEHMLSDINKGKPSFRDVYGENLEINKNAQPHWTNAILSGANFRNEILEAMAEEFLK